MIIWHVGGGGGGYGKAQDLAERDRDRVFFRLFEANVDRRETGFADKTHVLCLGSHRGVFSFYVYEYEPCSSIYRMNPKHAGEITGNTKRHTWGDHAALRATRGVMGETIDHLVGAGFLVPDFLSLDAQGAEYSILTGAHRALPDILGVLTEFQTAEVYTGQGLFHDQSRLLHERGFRLADIIRKEFWTRDGTRLLTAGDALFLNCGAHLTADQIAKRDSIAAFFGLRDKSQAQIDALEGAP